MRRRKRSALQVYQGHFGPNMTPMVDVVMVILVFFMASAAVLGPDWFIRAALPIRAATAAITDDALIRVELTLASGERGTTVSPAYLGAAPAGVSLPSAEAVPLAGLGSWLDELVRGAGAERLVVAITPSDAVPYQDVVAAHEACAVAGITRTGLATSPR
ncbi:MAG: biopolymer transporter ExbD [Phycisphaerae bacterium]|nr:biopolymer transporter ExbD [Phycisphaerae bacterium]